MKYNTEKHKPMMIQTEVKDRLDVVRKQLLIDNLNEGGKGRVSYGETIEFLIKEYENK